MPLPICRANASFTSRLLAGLFIGVFSLVPASSARAQDHGGEDESNSRYSDEPIPLAILPDRPKPIFELGEPFLGTGTLKKGMRMPTGAVWQPALMAFGTLRSAVQGLNRSVGDQDINLTEAAFRFDLFGNLYLTSTERVLVGFRPLDQDGRFTRYTLASSAESTEEDFEEELNFGVRTLFFEGDLGELFPAADWRDSKGLDIGISVGRQPLSFQEGLLLNEDAIDMVGLTKANMRFGALVNMRATLLFGWGDIDRTVGAGEGANGANRGDKSAMLFGLFTETDTRKRTVEADVAVVLADDLEGDGAYAGLSSIRRIGRFNNVWRAVASGVIGEQGIHTGNGVILTDQFSWTPHHTHNHVYISGFVGLGEFRSAARGPSTGGPLGGTGLLFASVGLGRFGAPLGNQPDYAYGGSIGYQLFFKGTRQQVIVEVGGRSNYDVQGLVQTDAFGGTARYQVALLRRGVLLVDGLVVSTTEGDVTTGARLELVIQL
ncbi:MAG: hypothetical protein SH809_00585 [Rhodothermales bacterium]|nr:hypothetical protein [Rhodothermales bacterium]